MKPSEIKVGDSIIIPFVGVRAVVTHIRKSRRYKGYYAIQYKNGDFVTQYDAKATQEIEVVK